MRKMRCALILLMALALPGVAQGVTYWEEDFENHLWTGSNGNPWDTSSCPGPPAPDGCNAAISTDSFSGWPFSGTHSLKSTYGGSGLDQGTYYNRPYATTTDVWVRFYYRTVGFTYEPTAGTKHVKVFSAAPLYPDFWMINLFGSREMGVNAEKIQDCPGVPNCYDSVNFFPNIASRPLNDNQIYCIEGHFLLNTPGVPNGLIELWVDSTLTLQYTNWRFRGPNPTNGAGPPYNSSNMNFDTFMHYTQHGLGLKYMDLIAVGDTRIGCVGAPLAPPAHPSNLRITLGILSAALAAAFVLGCRK